MARAVAPARARPFASATDGRRRSEAVQRARAAPSATPHVDFGSWTGKPTWVSATTNLERYRTISALGSGGMSSVVLAEDTLLGRRVALKRMHAGEDARRLSRLRREALIGASVSHPNLVPIYDIVTAADGDSVIVMEYVEGQTLRERLRREGPLPIPLALRV